MPGQAEAEDRVHVEMGIDEGRADELAGDVDLTAGDGGKARLDRDDALAFDADIDADAAVRQGRVAQSSPCRRARRP